MTGPDDATSRWVWWGIGAVASLIAVVAAVFMAEMNSALLLGWAIGMIVVAILMLFWRTV